MSDNSVQMSYNQRAKKYMKQLNAEELQEKVGNAKRIPKETV
jgi:hypothetical protein